MEPDLLPAVPESLDIVEDPGAFMLALVDQARALLEQAKGMEGLATVLEVKSRAEAIRVYTEQKKMGHEAELSAAEIVRRADRRIGELIREGQADGEIARAGQALAGTFNPSTGRVGVREHQLDSPTDFATADELKRGIYPVTDGVSDECFETAIAEAKTEGNLSRANVIRKIVSPGEPPSPKSRAAIDARRQRIREMAAAGFHSTQIAAELGIQERTVREIALDQNIELVANRVVGRRARLDTNRIISEAAVTLEGVVMGLDLVEWTAVNANEVKTWAASFSQSLRSLNRFATQLKEQARDQRTC